MSVSVTIFFGHCCPRFIIARRFLKQAIFPLHVKKEEGRLRFETLWRLKSKTMEMFKALVKSVAFG
jgi:hypothetical protein